MPSQIEIADHLGISQKTVSELSAKLGIGWKNSTLDEFRLAYIKHLQALAAGHKTDDGHDLIRERVMTERVDRELKQLQVDEKRGVLINVTQLEPELMNMVGAFRSELLSRDDKLKNDLDALYEIDVDVTLLNKYTHAALEQFGRYYAGNTKVASEDDEGIAAT